MIEIAFIGFCATAMWSYFDAKDHAVGSYWLAFPVGIGLLLNWYSWVMVFFPMFLVLLLVSHALKRYTKGMRLGFADVVGVPFALWAMLEGGFVMTTVFTLTLCIMTFFYDRMPRLLVPKRWEGKMIYLPVVFNSVLFGIIAHVLSARLF